MNKKEIKIYLLLVGCAGLAVMAIGSALSVFEPNFTNIGLLWMFTILIAVSV